MTVVLATGLSFWTADTSSTSRATRPGAWGVGTQQGIGRARALVREIAQEKGPKTVYASDYSAGIASVIANACHM